MVEGFSEEPICESSVSAFTERRGELGDAGVGVGVLAEFCAVLGLPFEGVELGFDNCVWKVLEWDFVCNGVISFFRGALVVDVSTRSRIFKLG